MSEIHEEVEKAKEGDVTAAAKVREWSDTIINAAGGVIDLFGRRQTPGYAPPPATQQAGINWNVVLLVGVGLLVLMLVFRRNNPVRDAKGRFVKK